MSLQITVRGSAERTYRAERGVVTLAAHVEGPDRADVVTRAQAALDPLTAQLGELQQRGVVGPWSNDEVRVVSQHPWIGDRRSPDVVHTATFGLRAEFLDFERLAGFVDHWAGRDGVDVRGVEWDVLTKHRRTYLAEVRKAAVDDAVTSAQAYADAVRRGRVTVVEIADPGMLGGGTGDAGHLPMAKAAVFSGTADDGPTFHLEPQDIVLEASVDARLTAD